MHCLLKIVMRRYIESILINANDIFVPSQFLDSLIFSIQALKVTKMKKKENRRNLKIDLSMNIFEVIQ